MRNIKDRKLRELYPASGFEDSGVASRLTKSGKADLVRDWELFVIWRQGAGARDLKECPACLTPELHWLLANRLGFGTGALIADVVRFFNARLRADADYQYVLQATAMKNPTYFDSWGPYRDCVDLYNAMQAVAKAYIYT